MFFMDAYPDRIREVMAAKGLMPEDVARQVKDKEFTLGYLYKMLRGAAASPSYRVIKALADILGVTVSWLMEGPAPDNAVLEAREVYDSTSVLLTPTRERWNNDVVRAMFKHLEVLEEQVGDVPTLLQKWAELSPNAIMVVADLIEIEYWRLQRNASGRIRRLKASGRQFEMLATPGEALVLGTAPEDVPEKVSYPRARRKKRA